MNKDLAQINQLRLELNRRNTEYRRKQSLDNAIRERVIGRFVLRVLEGNQAKILTFALGAHTLDAFVTKAKERKILGLDGHQADSVDGPAAAFERKPTVLNPVATAITQQR